jgi:hypothetical protein
MALLCLTSGLASRPGHLTPGERTHPLNRRLGVPQRRPGRCGIVQNTFPLPEIKNCPSSLQPVAIPTELFQILLRTIGPLRNVKTS